jgi:hypothetical protein
VVNLVLDDPGRPTGEHPVNVAAVLVESANADGVVALDHARESGHTEAPFEEGCRTGILDRFDGGVDEDGERQVGTVPLLPLLRRETVPAAWAVAQNGELDRQRHLRCGQADAGSGVHRDPHVLDQPQKRLRAELGRVDGP